jgi:hypothetical protein
MYACKYVQKIGCVRVYVHVTYLGRKTFVSFVYKCMYVNQVYMSSYTNVYTLYMCHTIC